MATPPKKPAAKKARTPTRPKHLVKGRWLGDFPRLSAAEKRLVECCARGEAWWPEGWDWQVSARPTKETTSNTIRAALIRFLALGGDSYHPAHETGVIVLGAWITGRLNLHQCRAAVRINLERCHFDSKPSLTAAHMPELALTGCLLTGLQADRLSVAGGVFLDDGFSATGEVRLLGAAIGGDLVCRDGSFTNKDGDALSADGIKVTGNVFLRDGFAATGAVRLPGAKIGGDLVCANGTFTNKDGVALNADGIKVAGGVFLDDGFAATGEVRILGAEIGGDLACGNGTFTNKDSDALSADGIKVVGGFILRTATVNGAIALTSAQIGTLIDQDFNWQPGGHLLDGLRYDRIIGPTDAASRITMLKSQEPNQLDARDWAPQPWEQLIKVLREMGHPGAAAEVAMEKQRMMRAAGQIGTREPNSRFKSEWRRGLDAWWTRISNALVRQFHDFYGWIAGYGYRPTRIVGKMALMWLLCALCYEGGREWGYFGPANPVIQTQASLESCGAPGDTNPDGSPKAFWTSIACPTPPEYTTLFPLAYSADLILPLIDLQQDRDWSPMVVNGGGEQLFFGYLLRALMWLEILFGWFASLMFVAIVSRLVEKD